MSHSYVKYPESRLFPSPTSQARTGTSCLSAALDPSAALDDVQTEPQLNLDTGGHLVSSPSDLEFCSSYIYNHIDNVAIYHTDIHVIT